MISVIIPTYRAEKEIESLIAQIRKTTIDDCEILVIDSSSGDRTVTIAQSMGARTVVIPREEFRHSVTRTYAAGLTAGEVVVFLTQDVVLFDDSIDRIVEAFRDPDVAVAYGRQLPKPDADPLAAHLRFFNYPEQGHVRTKEDIPKLGIKAAFNSNSFAAYRRSFMDSAGWFGDAGFSEDAYAAAKAILAGKKVAYAAAARVLHSHNHTVREVYRRYIQIGRAYGSESWILSNFGSPAGEGFKFVLSEWKYLLRKGKFGWLFKSALATLAKGLGYRRGKREAARGIR